MPRPLLTAAHQLFHLRRSEISQGEGTIRGGRLIWRFDVRPMPLSRCYRVHIDLQQGFPPEVVVIDPDLRLLADGRRLPHVYSEEPVQLCLYLPRTNEWAPSDRLDLTVVPWTYLWLFYFEEWLHSDEWKGGGEHPEPGNRLPRHELFSQPLAARARPRARFGRI